MTVTQSTESTDALRAKILGETARLAWHELQRFFAAGAVIVVDDRLDLVDVACQVALDNKTAIEQWLAAGQIGRISDAQAQTWLQADAALWTVIVKPWILVQQRSH